MITTTLKKIRQHRPCGLERGSGEGYDLLRTNLGKGYGDNTPIKFSRIAESNGIEDAVWCLRTICPEHDKEVRLFAADCADRVLHIYEAEYPNDDRPRKAIQASRDFANSLIMEEELQAARAASGAAARIAADAAKSAAWAASRSAARSVAWVVAWDVFWAALDAEKAIQLNMLKERFS